MNELARQMRLKRGTSSQRLMGEAIGISKHFVSAIELGQRLPRKPQHIAGIAEVLGVDTDQVYAWCDECPPDLTEHLRGNYAAIKRVRMLEDI